MTEQQHPIKVPSELLHQWRQEASIALNPTLDPRDYVIAREEWIATKASQWGWEQRGAADWQLEQVIDWGYKHLYPDQINDLVEAMRPTFTQENNQ